MPKTPHDPNDHELSKEVDELLKKLPSAEREDEDGEQSAPDAEGALAEGDGIERDGSIDARYPRAMIWGRVGLGVGFAGFMTQWPYTTACDFPLYLYLAAVTVLLIAGVWTAVWAWRRHMPMAHVLSLGVIGSGAMLAGGAVLPRIGYAKDAATWRCASVETTTAVVTRHVPTDVGYVPLGRDSLFYAATGSGLPLVLVGGTSVDHRQWDDLALRLAERFRVIRYDPPGSGRSRDAQWTGSALDPITAVLDALRIMSARVVGHSVGGTAALDFALASPDRVEALAVISAQPSGYRAFTPFDLNREQVMRLLDRDGVVGLSEFLLGDAYYLPEGRFRTELRGRVETLVRQNARAWRLAPDSLTLAGDALTRLESVTVPVLVVKPALDFPDLVAVADTIANRVPGAVTQEIPRAGHMVHVTDPDRLGEILLEFFRRE